MTPVTRLGAVAAVALLVVGCSSPAPQGSPTAAPAGTGAANVPEACQGKTGSGNKRPYLSSLPNAGHERATVDRVG